MKIEKYHVRKAYNEIDRRIQSLVDEGTLRKECEIREERNSMLQGVYSTFMMIADNWPDVRYWCDVNERERGYYECIAE